MIRQGLMRFIKDCIFDTAFLPENVSAGRVMMFVIPVGQYAGRQIKNYHHTNMLQGGMMCAPEKFFIDSLHTSFVRSDLYGKDFWAEEIPQQSKLWDGTLRLDSLGRTVREWQLRDLIDLKCVEMVKDSMQRRESKKFIDADIDIVNREPDDMLLEQQACFNFLLETRHANVPLDLLVVAQGVRAIPVFDDLHDFIYVPDPMKVKS